MAASKPSVRMKRNHPLSEVYRLLEPGPVLLVSTRHRGRDNIQTIAWYTLLEFVPPIVGCVIAGEVSSEYLRATRECVLNIPARALARKVVKCGSVSGRRTDKFAAFGLTPAPSAKVKVSRVEECFANLECRVVRHSPPGLRERYAFVLLEVVKAWIDPAERDPITFHHRGKGVFYESGKAFRIPFRAGR